MAAKKFDWSHQVNPEGDYEGGHYWVPCAKCEKHFVAIFRVDCVCRKCATPDYSNRPKTGKGSMAGLRAGKPSGHPFLMGRPKGVWYADAVGKVTNYPPTQEAYDAVRNRLRAELEKNQAAGVKMTRKGITDGFSGKAAKIGQFKAKAEIEARKIYAIMEEQELLASKDIGAEAMLAVLKIVRDESEGKRERLAAMKTVLEYTTPKPATTSKLELTRPEAFLDELLAAAEE